MFPIWDETGRIVGFSARILEKDAKQAKYVNSPDGPLFHKGKLLYGLHFARQSFKELGTAIICEGQLDTIACHRAGMTNAVAPQGTAFTEEHARLLARFTKSVTFCFDADEAGENAALRSIGVAIACGLEPKTVTLPFDQDPDSLYQAQGPEALAAALRNSQDALAFVLALARRKHDPASIEGRTRIVEMLLPVIAEFAGPTAAVTRAGYCQWLATELRLPAEAVQEALRQHFAAKQRGLRKHGTGQPPETPAAPPPKPALLTSVQRAEAMLFDLALRNEPAAQELAGRLDHDRVSDTPVGRALNHVIGMAAQGEWGQAAQDLLKDPELSRDADIARILFSGEFQPPEAGADAAAQDRYAKRLRKAMDDCLAHIERDAVSRELETLQRALAAETDPARAEEITRRIQKLARQRSELQGRQ